MSEAKIHPGLTGTAGLLVVLAILVVLNMVVSPFRLRKDFTEEKLYTLSQGTRELLADLPREVTLKFYFSKSSADVPITLKQYAQRVRDLLNEYETSGGAQVVFEEYDPQPDSDEEEWAQRCGLTGQPLNPLGGVPLYFGVVATSGPREAVIPFVTPQMEPQLEYALTRLVDEVSATQITKVGVLSSLPVNGSPANPFGPPPEDPKWPLISELEKQFETEMLSPELQRIPEDITLLLVIHPRDFSPSTLYAIDQFVLRGGRLLGLVDPLCISDKSEQDNPMMQQTPGGQSDLNTLSRAWGFTLTNAQVVADPRAATRLNLGQGVVAEVPAFLSLKNDSVSQEDIATSSLETLMIPFAGSIQGEAVEGLTATTLLHSSAESVLLNSFMATQPGNRSLQSGSPIDKPALAIRLTGTFPTAFPDGPPPASDEDQAATRTETEEPLKSSVEPSSVVLIADVDFVHADFSTREINIFGQRLSQQINDNVSLVLNLAEQMTGSTGLISLRSRGTFNRPFDRVEELSLEASRKWQAEEERLTQSLQEAQRKLAQLQSAKSQDQQLILSPEQAAEIQKFKTQRFEAQKRLREVRKNLRSDIEKLGYQLKAINLAAVPLAVALFGMIRWGFRRRRAARAQNSNR